jgi:hypothetical protein
VTSVAHHSTTAATFFPRQVPKPTTKSLTLIAAVVFHDGCFKCQRFCAGHRQKAFGYLLGITPVLTLSRSSHIVCTVVAPFPSPLQSQIPLKGHWALRNHSSSTSILFARACCWIRTNYVQPRPTYLLFVECVHVLEGWREGKTSPSGAALSSNIASRSFPITFKCSGFTRLKSSEGGDEDKSGSGFQSLENLLGLVCRFFFLQSCLPAPK